MKKKTKTIGVLLTGIALAVGIAVSGGVIRNSYVKSGVEATVQSGWSRVTAVSELTDGGTFIIGYEATANSDVIIPLRSDGAAATTSADGLLYSGTTAGSAKDGTINMSSIADTTPYEVTITASSTTSGAINIALASGNFVGNSGAKNTARLYASASVNADYTPTIGSNDVVTLTSPTSVSTTYTTLQYNTSSPRFCNYGGTQKNVVIYEKGASASLESLSVSGTLTKTSYYAGESFDPAGLTITANYDDESSADVTSECTFSPNPLTDGVISVTASYMEGEVTKTVNIGGFSVSTRSVTSISVLTNPTKTSYTIGQSFDPAGMKIRAVYNIGPINDDYTAYTYSPTSAFDSLGEKTITITSTENASATTTLTVNVQEYAEGTFTISAKDDSYLNPYDVVETLLPGLDIAKSDPNLENLTIVSIKDFRLSSTKSGISHLGTLTLGANDTTGGEMVIDLPDNLFATEVKLNGIQVLSSTTFKVNEVTNNAVDGTSVIAHIYSNTITISSLESNSRIWFDSFEIVAKSASNSAIDYGAHFLATTADECSSLSVSLGTWNNLKGLYENADSAVQNVIKAADADVGGSDLEKAIARYTFIAEKYGYDDFMDLGIVSGANQFNVIADNKTNIAIIIVVSLIGVSLLVGHRLIYKRKEN